LTEHRGPITIKAQTMTRALIPLLLLLTVAHVAAPRDAHAEPRPPCADEAAAVKSMAKRDPSLAYPKNARALEHVDAGRRAFGVQLYDKAVEEYTSAGLADEAPLILYNLGQTYRAAKAYEKAIPQYDLFLERGKPGPEVRALIVCHIATMKAELEHAASTAPLSGPASDQVATATTRRDGSPAARNDTHPTYSRWTTTRRIAVGVGTTGLLGLAAGVVFGLQTRGLKDDAARLCPTSSCTDADKANALSDRADKRATLANVSFGVSAAMIAGAAVLWYVGGPSGTASTSRSDTAVAPCLGPTFIGIAYNGTF
jgi:tetratricopeptide (TPR) repeat protein